MQRVVVLGGGVGGTLAANLIARKLKSAIARREARVTRRRHHGQPRLPARLHVHRDGPRAGEQARPAGAVAARRQRRAGGRRGGPDRRRRPGGRAGLGRAPRVRPAGHRHGLADRARVHRALRHRGAPLLHRRGIGPPAQGARRVHRRADRDRHRRHPLQVPAGPARGRLPDRIRAAGAGSARPDRDHLPVADQPRVHDRERVRDGDPDLRAEGHPPRASGRHRPDRCGAQGGDHRCVRGAPVRPPDRGAARTRARRC